MHEGRKEWRERVASRLRTLYKQPISPEMVRFYSIEFNADGRISGKAKLRDFAIPFTVTKGFLDGPRARTKNHRLG